MAVLYLTEQGASRKKTNPRKGIATPPRRLFGLGLLPRRKEPNPRKGIETYDCPDQQRLRDVFVGKNLILVRGLKLPHSLSLACHSSRGKETNPRKGIETLICPLLWRLPFQREKEPNPRKGIETEFAMM